MHYSPIPMHIPDGFLSMLVATAAWLAAAAVISLALRKVGKEIDERQAPVMGILAAAIFAGQMLNFSVTGGTSGHLLGAALAAILLGPWPAVLVMTAVVSTQALLFQDGGLLALGANLVNMAFVGVFVGASAFRLVQKVAGSQKWSLFAGGFTAAWLSIFAASLSCALQLAVSGVSPARIVFPAMGGIHALIGVGEGLITVGALALVRAARPNLLQERTDAARSDRGLVTAGGLITLSLAVLSPLASSHPDGLEWVAENLGFLENARDAVYKLIPDYAMPGFSNPAAATIAAGILGALVVFTAAWAVGHNRSRRDVTEAQKSH